MGIEAKLISTLTSAKTGTVVKKMLNSEGRLQRVIQYGEKTPLRQIGIDTVSITTHKNGNQYYRFFSENSNKRLFVLGKYKDGSLGSGCWQEALEPIIEYNSFQKTLKNIFDALRASKAMIG